MVISSGVNPRHRSVAELTLDEIDLSGAFRAGMW